MPDKKLLGLDLVALCTAGGLYGKHLSKDGKWINWSDNTMTKKVTFDEYFAEEKVVVNDEGIVSPADGFTTFVNGNGIRVYSVPNELDVNSIEWDE